MYAQSGKNTLSSRDCWSTANEIYRVNVKFLPCALHYSNSTGWVIMCDIIKSRSIYIYIYIERERERERESSVFTNVNLLQAYCLPTSQNTLITLLLLLLPPAETRLCDMVSTNRVGCQSQQPSSVSLDRQTDSSTSLGVFKSEHHVTHDGRRSLNDNTVTHSPWSPMGTMYCIVSGHATQAACIVSLNWMLLCTVLPQMAAEL